MKTQLDRAIAKFKEQKRFRIANLRLKETINDLEKDLEFQKEQLQNWHNRLGGKQPFICVFLLICVQRCLFFLPSRHFEPGIRCKSRAAVNVEYMKYRTVNDAQFIMKKRLQKIRQSSFTWRF